MRRPLETVMVWPPRVRLTQKIPIVETEELVMRFAEKPDYQPILVANTKSVAQQSYYSFCEDEIILRNLLRAIISDMYTVSLRAQLYLRRLLNDTYGDSLVFKEFEDKIQFLMEISKELEVLSKKVEQVANTTKDYSLEIGEELGIKLPRTLISS